MNLFFKRAAILLSASIVLVSCGSTVMEPLYVKVPTIAKVPDIKIQDELDIPKDKQLVLNITLFEEGIPNKDDYVNSPGATRVGEKRPSVIIAVPKETGGNNKEFEHEDDREIIFGTSGYYNEAEQYVEQDLLRQGFAVLDRSKFEAKHRDLRDKAEYNKSSWMDSRTRNSLENGEYDVIKTDLKNKFENGKLTLNQYQTQIDEVNNHSQRDLPDKKRDNNDEMNDIAEVIRAAQTGADQVDYLLQINDVKIGEAGDRKLSIKDLPEVNEFLNQNVGLEYGELPYALPAQISSNWSRSSINAKLIEIKTGSIVWLGQHEHESWSAEEIKVTINGTKKVLNGSKVNGVISSHNAKLKSKQNRFINAQEELNTIYNKCLTKIKYESKEELKIEEGNIKSKISSLESELKTLTSDIKTLQANAPTFNSNSWEYSYIIETPIIEPNLSDPKNKLEERELLKHRAKLIKSVSKSLINTIKIN